MWQGEFFMTEFVKKVIVLDQIANGFGLPGKKVSGVVKVQKNGQKLFAGVYVANFCKSKADARQSATFANPVQGLSIGM